MRGKARDLRGVGLGLLAALLVPVFAGCPSVQNAIDCSGICNRYQNCFDASYDTSSCESRCHKSSQADAAYSQNISACSTCISDKSCTSATFTCATECSGVVP